MATAAFMRFFSCGVKMTTNHNNVNLHFNKKNDSHSVHHAIRRQFVYCLIDYGRQSYQTVKKSLQYLKETVDFQLKV